LSNWSKASAGERVTVAIEHRPGIPEVLLDADRLNQVLLNLFLNGIEAMDRGVF